MASFCLCEIFFPVLCPVLTPGILFLSTFLLLQLLHRSVFNDSASAQASPFSSGLYFENVCFICGFCIVSCISVFNYLGFPFYFHEYFLSNGN